MADVDLCKDDVNYVVPPQLQPSGRHVTGVSFFRPYVEHWTALHNYFKKKGASMCFLTPVRHGNWSLPNGLSVLQDTGIPLNVKRTTVDHGLHYSVFPNRRMPLSEFSAKVDELLTDVCGLLAAGSSPEDTGDAALPGAPVPSDPSMQFVTQALLSLSNTTTDPNLSFYAYLLYYYIGMDDLPFASIEADCYVTRLVAHAMNTYSPPADVLFGDIMYNNVQLALGKVLPHHQPRLLGYGSSSDGEEE
jgi:hypothetical protein